MEKLTPFLAFLFIILESQGQKNDHKIGLSGSLQYSLTPFKEVQSSEPRRNSYPQYNNYRAILSYNINVDVHFLLSKKVSVSTGLGMTYFRYKANYNGVIYTFDGFKIPETRTTTQAYIKFPLKIEYKLINKEKFSVSPVIGATFWYYTYQKVKTEYKNAEQANDYPSIDYSKNIIPNAYAGLRITYDVTNKFEISCEPFFEKGITSVSSKLDGHSHSMTGVNMGLFYKL